MGDSPPFFYEWWFWATFLKAEGNPPLVFVRSVIGEGMTGCRGYYLSGDTGGRETVPD